MRKSCPTSDRKERDFAITIYILGRSVFMGRFVRFGLQRKLDLPCLLELDHKLAVSLGSFRALWLSSG
ncbi:hypothetical protein WT15_16540 [Burkholderia stagnalis]|nr:hypothetical protein WT15_16540 [Burkholderia stagnalis]KWO29174.1 hypothetical protein WT95_18910 [Burkholderia stagnalis]